MNYTFGGSVGKGTDVGFFLSRFLSNEPTTSDTYF